MLFHCSLQHRALFALLHFAVLLAWQLTRSFDGERFLAGEKMARRIYLPSRRHVDVGGVD